jgi:hypothetical protein
MAKHLLSFQELSLHLISSEDPIANTNNMVYGGAPDIKVYQ